ncbi:hypothetical protein HMPREF1022_02262 [Desulfovibrio sp. 6_1_46AFAA]|uniref:hypothetical protein n=1 Tax=Desulfovibrio sp. 6_1_46AFAA TaxID=665942 RepID=UPI0002236C99|nr:hypothetical protein [Desulfovibrio sp. 6_1_46AFAA]EGW50701.1 hypothetical protein HMPREF1022_02262 [Desulfovibrio sp. 6_1_46AFAA]
MSIDMVLTVKILEYLSSMSPCTLSSSDFSALQKLADGDELKLARHLRYLEGHGFIEKGSVVFSASFPMINVASLCITQSGEDYLMSEGGLTAYKNTITVRFHAEAIALIERAILNSDLAPQEKTSYLSRIRELPFSATEHLLKRLLDLGLRHVPDVVQLVQKFLL